MRYDPNDRDQRYILVVPPGMSLTAATWEHQMRTGYGGGHVVYFQRAGETAQQAIDRAKAFCAQPCYPDELD